MTYTHHQVLPEHTRLGVYEIKDILKVSPFSISYFAWNHHLNERVMLYEYFPYDLAIRGEDGLKVEPKLPDNREDLEYGLEAFMRQAEILTQINHPNIAVAENALPFNDTAYLVVDYQEGTFLSEFVHSSTIFPEAKVRYILVSMLNALQRIHENKIVHGGISPEAILLDKQSKPVLTDFSAARLVLALRIGKLDDELSAGYSSLEQYGDTHETRPASDFYALGATMYHLITHNQPVSAPDRLLVMSKNEPDPMILHTSSLKAAYSANLLETIDWMLHSDYQERPQTAVEILAALASESPNDQLETTEPGQKAANVVSSSPVEKNHVFFMVMAGIMAMIGGGLWFGEKTTGSQDEASNIVSGSTMSQQHTNQIAIKPVTKKIGPHSVIDNDLGQESESGIISATSESENLETEKQVTNIDKKTVLRATNDNKQSEIGISQESIDVNVEDDEPASEIKKQSLPERPASPHTIKRHLAAAEKAMREMRFTTPVGNSAYENYQTILIDDPNNAQALAGLQKIVDRYIGLIEEAQEEGQMNTARVYLLRAQAVIPENSKLQSIHSELNAEENND